MLLQRGTQVHRYAEQQRGHVPADIPKGCEEAPEEVPLAEEEDGKHEDPVCGHHVRRYLPRTRGTTTDSSATESHSIRIVSGCYLCPRRIGVDEDVSVWPEGMGSESGALRTVTTHQSGQRVVRKGDCGDASGSESW